MFNLNTIFKFKFSESLQHVYKNIIFKKLCGYVSHRLYWILIFFCFLTFCRFWNVIMHISKLFSFTDYVYVILNLILPWYFLCRVDFLTICFAGFDVLQVIFRTERGLWYSANGALLPVYFISVNLFVIFISYSEIFTQFKFCVISS